MASMILSAAAEADPLFNKLAEVILQAAGDPDVASDDFPEIESSAEEPLKTWAEVDSPLFEGLEHKPKASWGPDDEGMDYSASKASRKSTNQLLKLVKTLQAGPGARASKGEATALENALYALNVADLIPAYDTRQPKALKSSVAKEIARHLPAESSARKVLVERISEGPSIDKARLQELVDAVVTSIAEHNPDLEEALQERGALRSLSRPIMEGILSGLDQVAHAKTASAHGDLHGSDTYHPAFGPEAPQWFRDQVKKVLDSKTKSVHVDIDLNTGDKSEFRSMADVTVGVKCEGDSGKILSENLKDLEEALKSPPATDKMEPLPGYAKVLGDKLILRYRPV